MQNGDTAIPTNPKNDSTQVKLFLQFSFIFFAISCRETPTDPPYTWGESMYFYPETSEMTVGETVVLDLNIDMDLHFFGLTFAVNYDPEYLSFNNETGFTTGMGAIQFAQADSGIIYITISQTQGMDPILANGILGLLEFTAVNTGATQVEYIEEDLYFYDADGIEFSVETINLYPAIIEIK